MLLIATTKHILAWMVQVASTREYTEPSGPVANVRRTTVPRLIPSCLSGMSLLSQDEPMVAHTPIRLVTPPKTQQRYRTQRGAISWSCCFASPSRNRSRLVNIGSGEFLCERIENSSALGDLKQIPPCFGGTHSLHQTHNLHFRSHQFVLRLSRPLQSRQ